VRTNRIIAIVCASLALLSVFLVNPFIEGYSMPVQVSITGAIGLVVGCVLYLILRRKHGSDGAAQRP